MVDVKQITQLLKQHFNITGTYEIDPVSGQVDVAGSVRITLSLREMPVQFRYVTESFYCDGFSLTTLNGAPMHVGGSFFCHMNKLTSLIGAPRIVGMHFHCGSNKLTNLEGSPHHVHGVFNCQDNPLQTLAGAPDFVSDMFVTQYSRNLPLLRLCMYPIIEIHNCPNLVYHICMKYKGTGKPGALKAAAELIRAGYAENARW